MKGPALVQDVTVNLSILVTGTEEEFDNTGLTEFRDAVEEKVRRVLNDAGFKTGMDIWAHRGPGGSRFYSPAEVVDEEGGFAKEVTIAYVMGAGDIERSLLEAYNDGGQDAVEKWVEANHPEWAHEYCDPCEAMTPTWDDVCAVCFSKRETGCNHIWQSGASNDWIFDECAICGTHRGKEG